MSDKTTPGQPQRDGSANPEFDTTFVNLPPDESSQTVEPLEGGATVIPPDPESVREFESADTGATVIQRFSGEEVAEEASDTVGQTEIDSRKPRGTNTEIMQTVVGNEVSGFAATTPGLPDLSADSTAIFSQSIGNRPPDDDDDTDWQTATNPIVPATAAQPKSPQLTTDRTIPTRRTVSRTEAQSDSNVASQIWNAVTTDDFANVVAIRTRTVSGDGPFEQSEDADFEIVRQLAEGGMGIVYIARQRSLNRELAIKTLKPASPPGGSRSGKAPSTKAASRAEKQRRQMFLSEALVTANLAHPNIVPIHDLCQTGDGMPYYVMKRVHGTPWNKLIREMSLAENLEVLHKVCDAVAYAHHHGVVNRDLKPENVMLGEFGEVMVLDWGLAVPAPHAVSMNFRSAVASFGAGTPAYMSPELWTGPPEAIGEWSDVYLLGAILFEVMTGQPPHEFSASGSRNSTNSFWQAIDGVLRENVIRKTDASGELMDIAMKAMRTEPEHRYTTVLEFQFAVRNFERHDESRRLSQRAAELVGDSAQAPRDYHSFQTSVALYEEALRTWPQNGPARAGLRLTRLRYAVLANARGDFDLGLQIASQESDDEFQALSQRLRSARRMRAGVKWTALAAMLCVVLLGAKSIYDNGIITNLNTEVIARKTEAQEAIAEAQVAQQSAMQATEQAETARHQADLALETAVAARSDAENSRLAEETANQKAAMANQDAIAASAKAMSAQQLATTATAAAEAANARVTQANQLVLVAEQREKAAALRQQEAETAARIAHVEIQSQSIRGLALNQNYSDALREIDRLLASDIFPQLPDDIRQQRTTELQAQREQLMKRARVTDDPVQAQAISPDGRWLASGDAAGRITVLQNPAETLAWDDQPRRQLLLLHSDPHQTVADPISALQFSAAGQLLITAGSQFAIWDLMTESSKVLTGHSAEIRGLDTAGGRAITGDAEGRIIVWDVASGTELTRIQATTSIHDVALVPESRIFLYAGGRGQLSASVLAYELAADATQLTTPENLAAGIAASGIAGNQRRPVRLGQLRMTRDRNDPPNRLSVSPDGRLLLISNSRNGSLLVLPSIPASELNGRNRFPFAHPADLEAQGHSDWLITQHDRPINEIAWSADGQRLATASDDRTVGIWRRQTSTNSENPPASDRSADDIRSLPGNTVVAIEKVLRGHGGRVLQAAFLNADGTRVVSTSADRFTRLWDLMTLDQDDRSILRAFELISLVPYESPLSESARRVAVRTSRSVRSDSYTFCATDSETPDAASGGDAVKEPAAGNPVRPDQRDYFVLNKDAAQHRGSVRAIQFSEDGQRLVTGAADGSVVVWDTVTRQPISGPQGHTRIHAGRELFHEGHEFNVARMRVVGVEQSLLATSGYDGSLRLWNMDPASGRAGVQQQSLSGLGLVSAFATSPDGRFLINSDELSTSHLGAGSCRVWNLGDLATAVRPQPSARLAGLHRSEITAIDVSHDNRLIATGGRDGMVGLWSVETMRLVGAAKAHAKDSIVTCLSWLRDGTLISAGLDGQLIRWKPILTASSESAPLPGEKSLNSADRLERLQTSDRLPTPIEWLAVSPDESHLLVISVKTDRRRKESTDHLELVSAESLRTDRRILPAVVAGQTQPAITSAQWSVDGSQVIVCVDDQVQFLNSADWRIVRVLQTGGLGADDALLLPASAASGARSRLVTFNGTAAQLWDLDTGEQVAAFRGPLAVGTVAVTRTQDHSLIATGGQTLRIFNSLESSDQFGQPLFRFRHPHPGRVTSTAFSPADPDLLASAGADGSVALWKWLRNEHRAELVRTVGRFGSPIVSIVWSADGTHLLTATLDGRVGCSSVDSSAEPSDREQSWRPLFAATDTELADAAFSSDNRYAVAVGRRVQTGESIGWVIAIDDAADPQKEGTDPAVQSLPTANPAPMPASSDGSRIECRFAGHSAGGITCAAFLPGSPYLVTGGVDGAVIVWNWQHPLPGEIPVAYEAYRFLSAEQQSAHSAPVTALSISPSGTVATASDDGTAILWTNPFAEQP